LIPKNWKKIYSRQLKRDNFGTKLVKYRIQNGNDLRQSGSNLRLHKWKCRKMSSIMLLVKNKISWESLCLFKITYWLFEVRRGRASMRYC